jgi:hypothetical protein
VLLVSAMTMALLLLMAPDLTAAARGRRSLHRLLVVLARAECRVAARRWRWG